MFTVLRRAKDSSAGPSSDMAQAASSILQTIATGVVPGSAEEMDWLNLRMAELRYRLSSDDSPPALLQVLSEAQGHFEAYSQTTVRRYEARAQETKVALSLVARTLEWAEREAAAAHKRADLMQSLLQRAGDASNMVLMKSRLAECSGYLREEWTARWRAAEQMLADLKVEAENLKVRNSGRQTPGEPGITERRGPIPISEVKATEPAEAARGYEPVERAAAEVPPEVASEDPVTGLSERCGAEQAIQQGYAGARRLIVVPASVDRLTMIEERYGAKVRDEVLVYFGQHFVQSLGAADRLYRWGPASFLLVLERQDSADWVRTQLEQILRARYRKQIDSDGRSGLLNVGLTWKMLCSNEFPSALGLIQRIGEFVKE